MPVHDADAIGGDPYPAHRIGHDPAIEPARRKTAFLVEQADALRAHPRDAGVGGQPECAAAVLHDAEHALDVCGQRHPLQLPPAAAVEPAIQRADPQRAVAIDMHRGDRRALQHRRHARVDIVEIRPAVVDQPAVRRQPDRAVPALCDGQHRALRQLVFVPDVGQLPDRAIGIERTCRRKREQTAHHKHQRTPAPDPTIHAQSNRSPCDLALRHGAIRHHAPAVGPEDRCANYRISR